MTLLWVTDGMGYPPAKMGLIRAFFTRYTMQYKSGVHNPSVRFDLDRYNLLPTGIPGQTSDITNDIGPMLQKKIPFFCIGGGERPAVNGCLHGLDEWLTAAAGKGTGVRQGRARQRVWRHVSPERTRGLATRRRPPRTG